MKTFTNWFPLVRLTLADMPRFGNISAVYAIRAKDSGDLLYMGCTGNLRRRLFGNHLGGVGGATTKRVNHLLFAEDWLPRVEVAWEETDEYKDLERELKAEYCEEHRCLPQWTRL